MQTIIMQHIKNQDYALIKAIQAGNKSAFNQIVLKYQYKILNWLQTYIKDRQECLDLVQEVFLKAYKSINYFQHKSSFYTWLYKITINTAKSYLTEKSNQKIPNVILEQFNQEYYLMLKNNNFDNNNPAQITSFNELENIFTIALENLPFELKNTLKLRELDGLTYEEIAEISVCPIGTVRSRISRARAAIEKNFQLQYKYYG